MYNITDTTVPSTSTRVLNRFYDLTTGEQELEGILGNLAAQIGIYGAACM